MSKQTFSINTCVYRTIAVPQFAEVEADTPAEAVALVLSGQVPLQDDIDIEELEGGNLGFIDVTDTDGADYHFDPTGKAI
jgi:hypothetical protein